MQCSQYIGKLEAAGNGIWTGSVHETANKSVCKTCMLAQYLAHFSCQCQLSAARVLRTSAIM
eukprot:5514360-Heterocapsa_arctica.AAC.1